MKRLILTLLPLCIAIAALGCGDASESAANGGDNVEQVSSEDLDSGDSGHSSSSEDDDSGRSSSSEDDDSGHDSGEDRSDDGVVSRVNPGFSGTGFDSSRNDALIDAQPLDAVTWIVEPSISPGAMEAKGVLEDGAVLFNPMIDGDGAGFIVYFKGMREPLLVLLPDLGPTQIWETDHTVAEMEHEFEGASFEFRAYSPLFMDVGPSDLELRVFGYDAGGADALLAVQPVSVP